MKVNIKVNRKSEPSQLIYLTILIGFMLIIFLILGFQPKNNIAALPKKSDHINPLSDSNPMLKKQTILIEQGTTLTDILATFHFTSNEIYMLREDVKPVYDLAKIKSGHELRIFTLPDNTFALLEYEIDNENYLSIKKENNHFIAEIKKVKLDTKTKLIEGVIKDNLIFAVQSAGENQKLAMMLSEIFAWDIDFYTDLRKGDSFKILFEKKFQENNFIDYGPILAIEFSNQKKTFQAFRYADKDSKKWDYFNFDGSSMKRDFLKSPISFARITSRFSYSRFHPIRKTFRPHMGVDYAAPVGTAVQATGDGTIIFAGRNGAAGRMIKIRHKNRYETQYLHLSRYAVKKNRKVKQGQVIGYVGNSGESTGPHLDYRIKKNNRYINPLSYRFKAVSPLKKEYLADFQKKAESMRFYFNIPLMYVKRIVNSILVST